MSYFERPVKNFGFFASRNEQNLQRLLEYQFIPIKFTIPPRLIIPIAYLDVAQLRQAIGSFVDETGLREVFNRFEEIEKNIAILASQTLLEFSNKIEPSVMIINRVIEQLYLTREMALKAASFIAKEIFPRSKRQISFLQAVEKAYLIKEIEPSRFKIPSPLVLTGVSSLFYRFFYSFYTGSGKAAQSFISLVETLDTKMEEADEISRLIREINRFVKLKAQLPHYCELLRESWEAFRTIVEVNPKSMRWRDFLSRALYLRKIFDRSSRDECVQKLAQSASLRARNSLETLAEWLEKRNVPKSQIDKCILFLRLLAKLRHEGAHFQTDPEVIKLLDYLNFGWRSPKPDWELGWNYLVKKLEESLSCLRQILSDDP